MIVSMWKSYMWTLDKKKEYESDLGSNEHFLFKKQWK